MIKPKIDIRMPWEPGKNLGGEYNRIFQESPHDWILFLDADVLIPHPSFYVVCQRVILDHVDAGMFTCRASSTGCVPLKSRGQGWNEAPMSQHRALARALWNEHKYKCARITITGEYRPKCFNNTIPPGYFMLLSRKAWIASGGFDNGFKVDHPFVWRVYQQFPIYNILGLYCYHVRDRSGERWIEDVPVSHERLHDPNEKTIGIGCEGV